jgi:phage-related protein
VLKEADLIQGDKSGTTITYRLNISVLEETLLSLMNVFNISPQRENEWNKKQELTLDPESSASS